jgi:hypothetical protein
MGFLLQLIDRLNHETSPCSQLMQVCFVRGVGSPCSHAGHLALIAPVCNQLLRASESRHGSTQMPERARSINRANPNLAKQAGRAHAMGPKHPMTSNAALALQASLPLIDHLSCETGPQGMAFQSAQSNSAAPSSSSGLRLLLFVNGTNFETAQITGNMVKCPLRFRICRSF